MTQENGPTPDMFRGMTEDQVEASFEVMPAWWNDPEQRALALGQDLLNIHASANLTQFGVAYRESLGDDAERIGWERNIQGQGLPKE